MNKITIIGPGLIGASLGLALKKNNLSKKILGIDKNKQNLINALKINAIDESYGRIDNKINESDIIFLCTPVGTFKNILQTINKFATRKLVVTDVGSVKGIFNEDFIKNLNNLDLVPGHPIAGTEFSGAINAKDKLFKGKWFILTPLKKTNNNNLIESLWTKIGMKVHFMKIEEHDALMSITSHLPHLIAFTIVGTAFKLSSKDKKNLYNFSAGGFKDFTRIGSSDPEMWKDIFLKNNKHLLKTLSEFTKDLKSLRKLIRENDSKGIMDILRKTKSIRKRILDADKS